MAPWNRRFATAVAVGLALAATACVTPAPQPSLDAARRAVERAERADARRYAPEDLAVARDELAIAEAAARDSANWIEARRLAERAEVDAQVALERTLSEKARISLEEIQRGMREASAP